MLTSRDTRARIRHPKFHHRYTIIVTFSENPFLLRCYRSRGFSACGHFSLCNTAMLSLTMTINLTEVQVKVRTFLRYGYDELITILCYCYITFFPSVPTYI